MLIPAAIFVLGFKHENAVEANVNICDNYGETLMRSLQQIEPQHTIVAKTGEAYPYSDKGRATTDKCDSLLSEFFDLEKILQSGRL